MDFVRRIGDNVAMSAENHIPGRDLAILIVAAGSGTRMAAAATTSSKPKQFRILAGKPVLQHSVEAALAHDTVKAITIVVAEDRIESAREIVKNAISTATETKIIIKIVAGGNTRQASVCAGLRSLAPDPPRMVAIHDAARPFLSAAILDRLTSALAPPMRAALPILLLSDTLKSCEDGRVVSTVDRGKVGAAQTPQLFFFDDIMALHAKHEDTASFTDDIGMAEAAGYPIASVQGESALMKITHEQDMILAEAFAEQNKHNRAEPDGTHHMYTNEMRVGNGYDVHRFSDGPGPIMLAGITVPSRHGMTAHSDGDVGLHALCDAIFGALADGDIGFHFPPSDARWKDADSAAFLAFAVERCNTHGAEILHLDLTIICEEPKITPHRDNMRRRIAEICNLCEHRVSVKATTSERLGFTGRGEGIAAQATATICYSANKS